PVGDLRARTKSTRSRPRTHRTHPPSALTPAISAPASRVIPIPGSRCGHNVNVRSLRAFDGVYALRRSLSFRRPREIGFAKLRVLSAGSRGRRGRRPAKGEPREAPKTNDEIARSDRTDQ